MPDLLARHDVVRLLEIPCVDLPRGKETLDLDRTRVLRTGDRSDLLLFIAIDVGGFRGLLVQSGGHRWQTFAPGRLGKFHRAGRRARRKVVKVAGSRGGRCNWG